MNHFDYKGYTADKLLLDTYFVSSCLNPTTESILFWDQLQTEDNDLANEIRIAIHVLKTIPHNKAKLSLEDEMELWKRIQTKNKVLAGSKKRIKLNYYLSIAASLLLIVAFGTLYVLKGNQEEMVSQIVKIQKPKKLSQNTQLILANNDELAVAGDESKIIYNKTGDLQINSQTVNAPLPKDLEEKEAPQYNQLIVPAGKRSNLDLSDGTKIWINANSRVVYPVVFEKTQRVIFVEGEVFLDVASDKNRPFIVKTKNLDVNVLGTSFNVSSYENEEQTAVVLVSGIVNIKTKKSQHEQLKPNEMYKYANNRGQRQKVNVMNYISWKDGAYVFEKESFETVLKKLGNYYGKKIIIDKKETQVFCSGTLKLKDDIISVLNGLKNTVSFTYQIEDDCIRISIKN